jgi:predicted O-linked N-acetylglucosamine transferase (SPINDLY family)
VLKYQTGKLEDALDLIAAALKVNRNSADALSNYGNVLNSLKRYEGALASYDRALAIKPDHIDAHNNRGDALLKLNCSEVALASFDRALSFKPNNAEALYNRGNALVKLLRHEEAIASYEKALVVKPNYPAALYNSGSALVELNRLEEALASFDQALTLQPQYPEVFNNRGKVLLDLNRHEEALASFDNALAVQPRDPAVHNNRGNALCQLNRHQEALASFDKALAIKPDNPEALYNRGNAFRDLYRYEAALSSYDQTLALKPDHADALNNRGNVLSQLNRHGEALASYKKARAILPDHLHALSGMVSSAQAICDWGETARLAGELDVHVAKAKSIISPFVFLGFSGSAASELRCAKNFIQAKIPKLPKPLWNGTIYRHDKIRIAYLSADFRRHPVAQLIAELLERHDRRRFEVLGVCFGHDDRSDVRARLIAAFDQFHHVRSKTDGEVAELLSRLQVDIAVDLMGYTQDCRPDILAHRPAPIQVNYLGYPGTLGAEFIDYVVADRLVAPFDQQPFFTEKIVHLPDSYLVHDSTIKIPERSPTRSEVGLPETGFVFCCFNNHNKITAPVFDIWMRLLQNIESSVLWLSRGNDQARDNLRREAAARGIEPSRLIFAPRLELLDDHLARHRLADLFLDTLPYNAHTTASDALWSGLPVLTCVGTTFAGRVGESLLHAACLPELVTYNLEDYEALATKLAADRSLLQRFKLRLNENQLTSPLFDTDRFRGHIEAAYTTMWEIWQRGDRPHSFAVERHREPSGKGDRGGTYFQARRNTSNQETPSASRQLKRGSLLHQQGKLADAEQLYLQILKTQPDHFDARHQLGVTLSGQGRNEEALTSIRAALQLNPNSAHALSNYGLLLHKLGRHEEALTIFDQALSIRPKYVEALCNRGNTLQQLERYEEALASYNRALAIRPDDIDGLCHRGNALRELKRYEEALASYENALAIRPDYAEALNNRGNTLQDLKRLEEALASYEKALEFRPDYAVALNNRGVALQALKRFEEALESNEKALAIRPDYAEALNNRGNTLKELRRFEEALANYDKAIALKPDYTYPFSGLADCAIKLCDWTRRDKISAELRRHVIGQKSIIAPFVLLGYSVDESVQLACAKNFIRDQIANPPQPLWRGTTWRNDKIKIAYLSADYRDHPVAHLSAELFELHDRTRFEVIGLSFGSDDRSEIRARLVKAFDRFQDVRSTSDRDAARLLHDLHVDIAVDLTGHTVDSRLGIFAHRPTPITAAYLGYPGTTGADFVDYIIADKIVLPFEQQAFYTEKIVHLPDCFQVNDRKRNIAARTPTRAEAGLPAKGFIFCCFNNNWKIAPEVFDVWMRLLGKTHGSVLWLSQAGEAAVRNLRREAEARGIGAARLIFAPRLARLEDHLARHRLIDLFLDNLPYNAHTTASDALWAGVPVLTCAGTTFSSRVGASLLHAASVPELITYNLEDYETLAMKFTTDRSLLQRIKLRLNENRLICPLFDTDRFRRHIEAAYTTMWEVWQREESPHGFSVEPVSKQ